MRCFRNNCPSARKASTAQSKYGAASEPGFLLNVRSAAASATAPSCVHCVQMSVTFFPRPPLAPRFLLQGGRPPVHDASPPLQGPPVSAPLRQGTAARAFRSVASQSVSHEYRCAFWCTVAYNFFSALERETQRNKHQVKVKVES